MYLGLSAQVVVGYLGVSPSVVGYLGLSAQVCGRLPRPVSPSVVGYLGLSAQVWSVTSVCQPKCGRLPRSVSQVWSVVDLQEVGEAPRQGRRHSARIRTRLQPVVLPQLGPGEALVDASNLKCVVLCVRFVSN